MNHIPFEVVLRTRAPRRLYDRVEAWRKHAGLSLSQALRVLIITGLDVQERQSATSEREAA